MGDVALYAFAAFDMVCLTCPFSLVEFTAWFAGWKILI